MMPLQSSDQSSANPSLELKKKFPLARWRSNATFQRVLGLTLKAVLLSADRGFDLLSLWNIVRSASTWLEIAAWPLKAPESAHFCHLFDGCSESLFCLYGIYARVAKSERSYANLPQKGAAFTPCGF